MDYKEDGPQAACRDLSWCFRDGFTDIWSTRSLRLGQGIATLPSQGSTAILGWLRGLSGIDMYKCQSHQMQMTEREGLMWDYEVRLKFESPSFRTQPESAVSRISALT